MLPIAAEIATRLTREEAQSARPNAPVIPLDGSSRRESKLARVHDVRRRKNRRGQSPSQFPTNPRHAW
jgi:hypothetical protein